MDRKNYVWHITRKLHLFWQYSTKYLFYSFVNCEYYNHEEKFLFDNPNTIKSEDHH